MFAVIRTGGKQYRVAPNEVITVEKIEGEHGAPVAFEVLMLGSEAGVTVGTPLVVGAGVEGSIVAQVRGEKVISFKKRRRQNSKRKRGHRQMLTQVRILGIRAEGFDPAAFARPANTDTPATDAAPAAPMSESAPAKAPKAAKIKAAPAAPAPSRDETNLSLIAGIGPTSETKLRAAGVTTWTQIAAWTEEEGDRLDVELKLGGRHRREEWSEQARELLDGKPPRAKVDQAELASGKDL